MSQPRRRLVNTQPETNWREASANMLKTMRETAGAQILEKMSHYTNRSLWKNAQTFTPAEVQATDPQDIKELKNLLLLLFYVEQTLRAGKNILRMPLMGIYNSLSNLPSLSETTNYLWKEIPNIVNLINSGKYTTNDVKNLATNVTERVKTLINYRQPAPNNPASAFELPAPSNNEWWSNDPAPSPNKEHLVNFEYEGIMNPIRRLMLGFDTIFPELQMSQVTFRDRGFLTTPSLDKAVEQYQQQKALRINLSALYNLMWAANRMGRGYLAHNKVQATLDLKDFVSGALENLSIIDTSSNIPREIAARMVTQYKKQLEKLKNTFLNFTSDDFAAIQQYEIEHHLKPGAVTGILRLVFDRIEDFYIANNLYFRNPFTTQPDKNAMRTMLNNPAVAAEKARLVATKNNYEAIKSQLEQIFIRGLPADSTARDNLLIATLRSITELLQTASLSALEKINLLETQDALIYQLSTAGKKQLQQILTSIQEPTHQALNSKLTQALNSPNVSSVKLLASLGTLYQAYTPGVVQTFLTSFFAPVLTPSAVVGKQMNVNSMQHDLIMLFSLPNNHNLKDIVVLTQEPASLIYIDERGRRNVLLNNEDEIKANAPFLEYYLNLNTELTSEADQPPSAALAVAAAKSKSIKQALSLEALQRLDNLIVEKGGPAFALTPNRGLLSFLDRSTQQCNERIRDIDRMQEELQAGMTQANLDILNYQYRSTMRILQPRDLLKMINAIRATQNEPTLNLDTKSRLAVLLADTMGQRRERYLENAHQIAVKAANDPKDLILIITDLFNHPMSTLEDKLLCRELMTQLALVSDIRLSTIPRDILNFSCNDPILMSRMLENCISAALTQFNAATFGDSMQSVAIFNLILRKQNITESAIELELQACKPANKQAYTVTMLFDLYQTAKNNPELQNQIGIFLANMAIHDPLAAQLIFSIDRNSVFLQTLKKSCLESGRKNVTLYYEAWINAQEFRLSERRGTTLEDLIANNQSIILDMYRELYPGSVTPSIPDLLKNPWDVCKLVGDFMMRFISPDSKADIILRQFFLNMVYSSGEKSAMIRKELAALYFSAEGTSDISYYKFLVPQYWTGESAHHFNQFWEETRKNLAIEMQNAMKTLQQMKSLFHLQIRGVPALIDQFDKYIVKIQITLEQLLDKTSKVDAACHQCRRNFILYQNQAMRVAGDIETLTIQAIPQRSPSAQQRRNNSASASSASHLTSPRNLGTFAHNPTARTDANQTGANLPHVKPISPGDGRKR